MGACMCKINGKSFLTTAIKFCFATGTWNLGHFSNIPTYSCEKHVSSHPFEKTYEFDQHINPSCSADAFQSLTKKITKPHGTSFKTTESISSPKLEEQP